MKTLLKSATKRLTGTSKRQFMAEVTLELFEGSPTKAERALGWGRETVRTGIRELTTGISSAFLSCFLVNAGIPKICEFSPAQ